MPDFLSQLVKRRETQSSDADASSEESSVRTIPLPEEEIDQPDQVSDDIAQITSSGLFDPNFYLTSNPDIAAAAIDPLDHFFHYGFQEGRRPNPYFDPLWYLNTNIDVREADTQPLLHYAMHGDKESRRPSLKF